MRKENMRDSIPFNIPFIGEEEINAAKKAILTKSISGNGYFGRELEEGIKSYTGARFAFFTTSCTSAIEIALMALAVGRGEEVIIPSFSFVSVANAIVKTGAKPVFVDIDSETFNIDPYLVKRAITRKTKAIIPVHYAGCSCQMDEILSIANKRALWVIEDAAQAIGSYYAGKHLGTIGDIGCLSLHGTKNITCGEGGIFLTNNKKIADKADIIREKGTNRSFFLKGKIDRYSWISSGSSYVQSDILAAIAIEQLKKIDRILQKRSRIAEYYNVRLKRFNPSMQIPCLTDKAKSNWHIYAILLKKGRRRDWLINELRKKRIECTPHFVPLHLSLFARKHFGHKKGDLPVTERVSDSIVRLPIYPQLSKDDLEYVVNVIEDVLSRM